MVYGCMYLIGLLGGVALAPTAGVVGRAAALGAGAVPHAATLLFILPAGVTRGAH